MHTNHFYNLKLIRLKAFSTVHQHAFQNHSAVWGGLFRKYQGFAILDETVETNRKSFFQLRNPSAPKSMLFAMF